MWLIIGGGCVWGKGGGNKLGHMEKLQKIIIGRRGGGSQINGVGGWWGEGLMCSQTSNNNRSEHKVCICLI